MALEYLREAAKQARKSRRERAGGICGTTRAGDPLEDARHGARRPYMVKEISTLFPILSGLARKYLAMPSSGAAVERMFSYTGGRIGKRRASLGNEQLLSLSFCRNLSIRTAPSACLFFSLVAWHFERGHIDWALRTARRVR